MSEENEGTVTTLEDSVEALSNDVRSILDQDFVTEEQLRSVFTEIVQERFPEGSGDLEVEGERRRGSDPSDRVIDLRYAHMEAGDFEIAAMMMEASHEFSRGKLNLNPSEDFQRAYNANVDRSQIMISENGTPVRAMDTQETGFGEQLIGAQYMNDMWNAERNTDVLLSSIPSIPMNAPTVHIPIDGSLPEMFLVGENTADNSSEYSKTATGSNRRTFTAKKFTVQQVWSGELNEDSIVAFTPYIRGMLSEAVAYNIGASMYNGDTTNAGTGNINLDDANPDDKAAYLAYDGIRHNALIGTGALQLNAGGAIEASDIVDARVLMGGSAWNGRVGTGRKANIQSWGQNARNLRLICDWSTYGDLIQLSQVLTLDKYGSGATILTGELGSIYGIPIMVPPYAPLTEDDGKLSNTLANNDKGQAVIFNPRGFMAGIRRDGEIYFDRIQGRDQFLLEFYTRRGFVSWGATGQSVVIRNITV